MKLSKKLFAVLLAVVLVIACMPAAFARTECPAAAFTDVDTSQYYHAGVDYMLSKGYMAGYQEIVSDPSYTDQAVVMTYPLIGNYGITDEDYETRFPTLGGLIVGEYNDLPSNFRCTKTLAEILEDYGIPGIEGIDTRKLTRSIRDLGSRRVFLTGADTPLEEGLRIIAGTPVPHDAAQFKYN